MYKNACVQKMCVAFLYAYMKSRLVLSFEFWVLSFDGTVAGWLLGLRRGTKSVRHQVGEDIVIGRMGKWQGVLRDGGERKTRRTRGRDWEREMQRGGAVPKRR